MNNNDIITVQNEALNGENIRDMLVETDNEELKSINDCLKDNQNDVSDSEYIDPFEGEVFDAEEIVCKDYSANEYPERDIDLKLNHTNYCEEHDVESDEAHVDEVESADQFLTPDDMNTLKYLQHNARINDINKMIEAVKSRCDGLLCGDNDELGIYLDTEAVKYTDEEIKSMTKEEIDTIYTYNGEHIGVSLENVDEYEFKKDYLILRKQSKEATEKFDKEIAKLNDEIAECQEEYNKAIEQFGSVSNLVSSRLDRCIEEAKTDDERERFLTYRIAFDNAFNLDNVVEFAKSYKGRSIIGSYRDNKKADDIYKRYIKVCSRIRSNNNLAKYANLEARFLEKEYNERPNLFVFIIIMLVSTWHNKPIKKTDVVFLSQFNINIRNLFYDNFDKEEVKQEFISNIKKVIEVFM